MLRSRLSSSSGSRLAPSSLITGRSPSTTARAAYGHAYKQQQCLDSKDSFSSIKGQSTSTTHKLPIIISSIWQARCICMTDMTTITGGSPVNNTARIACECNPRTCTTRVHGVNQQHNVCNMCNGAHQTHWCCMYANGLRVGNTLQSLCAYR